MELVDAPTMAPGVCALTNQGGTLIDTRREISQIGRAYLHPDVVREAAAVIGMVEGSDVEAALRGMNSQAEAMVALEAERDELLEKYNALRASMAETMQHGFVVDRRGTIRYREAKAGVRIAKEEE